MTTRRLSWLLAVLAFFGPALWAAHEIRIDAEAQRAAHGFLCGTPAVAITLLAVLAASVLSLASVGTNLWSLKPRPGTLTVGRKAEVLLLSAPALVGIGLTVYLVLFESPSFPLIAAAPEFPRANVAGALSARRRTTRCSGLATLAAELDIVRRHKHHYVVAARIWEQSALNDMKQRLGPFLVISGALVLAGMLLRFDAGPFLTLSYFDLMRGALSGGHWSVFRFTLLALFVLSVAGVLVGGILLLRRLTSRVQSGTSRT